MRTVGTCYFIPLAVLTLLTALLGCGGGGGGGTAGPDGAAYSIGGLVSGLSGTGLVLQNNSGDDLGIASSGTFTFAAQLADGAGYHVTVKTHPTALTQTCTASSNTGTVAGANVASVLVSCSTETYSVGGTVDGLSGTGLVLQNNSGDDLGIASSGTFTFATKLADGAGYHVTVKTHPAALTQTCAVSGGTGTIAGANVSSLLVSCSTETYSVGGTVTGLTGSGLTLLNNGGGQPSPVRGEHNVRLRDPDRRWSAVQRDGRFAARQPGADLRRKQRLRHGGRCQHHECRG